MLRIFKVHVQLLCGLHSLLRNPLCKALLDKSAELRLLEGVHGGQRQLLCHEGLFSQDGSFQGLVILQIEGTLTANTILTCIDQEGID